jgi:nicotinate-nucleotide adenylyltransferase
MSIGLFGGSFDPVHTGHIKLAEAARRELGLDRVIFIPARRPPHKQNKRLSPARIRLKMLASALKPYRGFSISRYELNRRATTYTYHTAGHFKKLYPRAEIYFIIGGDSLAELRTWKNADKLAETVRFLVGKRPGVKMPSAVPFKRSVIFLKTKLPAVSSSGIRQLASSGSRLAGLVPKGAERIIVKSRVYN